jgi:predicted transcriptional regulator
MARKQSPNLTEAELRIMKILWERKSATVGDVVEAMPKNPPVAYTTVLTLLRILESKGHVRHTKAGRAFVYWPNIDSNQASTKAVRHLLSRFFGGSASQLVMKLLDERQLDAEEISRIRKKIEENK